MCSTTRSTQPKSHSIAQALYSPIARMDAAPCGNDLFLLKNRRVWRKSSVEREEYRWKNLRR
ncbi:hypothetical protein K4039_02770 [Lyngbya sp. CCAP 1446/10]|uniref:hypothetical protein n=1 Tax=Microcoleaceae TaxID=1892252 RepID=UPI002237D705|nr:hypothetical protein [Lyngbya sp. CCAP 1446/10]MCW6049028.1 hypothetical protein [Lyngbya sp. CCAP 1446/10]